MNKERERQLRHKKKRKLKKKVSTYHYLYKRKGVYPFLVKNSIKLLIFILLIVIGLLVLQNQMPDLEATFHLFTNKFRPITILAIFFLSESFLGLIPPDFFLVWAKQFSSPYSMIALLGVLSYTGGVVSYFIGMFIGNIPKVHQWMENKFLDHIDKIKKWGGVLIVFSALFPLPYSPVCMAAGMVRFPFITLLLLGLFRFARIFGYAFILFKVT